MMAWIYFLGMSLAENYGYICFFDIFKPCKWKDKKSFLRYILCFSITVTTAIVVSAFFRDKESGPTGFLLRQICLIAGLIIVCRIAYTATWRLAAFIGTENFILGSIMDFGFAWLLEVMDKDVVGDLIGIFSVCTWLMIIKLLKRKLAGIQGLIDEKNNVWRTYFWFPGITMFVSIYFMVRIYFTSENQLFFSLLSAGLAIINIAALVFLKNAIKSDFHIKNLELQVLSKEKQLQGFFDVRSLCDSQGKILHDYKKQLGTIQSLLEDNHKDDAIKLLQGLTDRIIAEGIEINTGHPTVSAVLSQEYRLARTKGIGMSLSVGNMREFPMKDEDIVVLLGNLIENALHECESIQKENGTEVAFSVKFRNMGEDFLVSVQNPVRKKVEIVDNRIISRESNGRKGIGLANVFNVVDAYGGSVTISCDDREFIAVVMI